MNIQKVDFDHVTYEALDYAVKLSHNSKRHDFSVHGQHSAHILIVKLNESDIDEAWNTFKTKWLKIRILAALTT